MIGFPAELIPDLQNRLESQGNPKTKDWWERYLKHAISFRGVKMGDIRAALHAWYGERQLAEELSLAQQKELALELLRQPLADDKLAGILILQEILIPQHALQWSSDLPRLATLFQAGHIDDWNTCDWFCVKVLGPMVEQQGEPCARAIAAWREAPGLWQRRAAGVAFVNLAKRGDANFTGFVDMLLEVCAATVQSAERFAQTGTGWVLRELSYGEPQRVVDFIRQHRSAFTAEGWKYLTQKMPQPVVDAISERSLHGEEDSR